MKKLLFILLAISMFSCAKEENQNQSQTNINNNNNDTSKVEISLKRPDDADCNLTSKQQAKPAKKVTEEDYEAYLNECTIQVRLQNEEASLISYVSKNNTSTSKSKESTLLLPNMIWIEESWIQITSIGDTTKRKSVFGNFKVEAEEIQIPNTVKHIAAKAFSGCNNVSNIVMSQNLETIGENAFEFCSSLESIELPKSLEKLGNNAFESCAELKSISFESVPQMHIETIANIEKIEINATKFDEFKETFKEEISNSNLEDKIVAKEYVKCEEFSIKFLKEPTRNGDTIYLQIGETLEFEFETNPIEIDDKIYIQNYLWEELGENPIETHWLKINQNTIEAISGSPNAFVIGYHVGELEEKFVTIRIFEKLQIKEEISVFSASKFDFPVPTNLLSKDAQIKYYYNDGIMEKANGKYIIKDALWNEDIPVNVEVKELGITRKTSFTIKPKVLITSPLEATIYKDNQNVKVTFDNNKYKQITGWGVYGGDANICSFRHNTGNLTVTPKQTGDAQIKIDIYIIDLNDKKDTITTPFTLHCVKLEGNTVDGQKTYNLGDTVNIFNLLTDNSFEVIDFTSNVEGITINGTGNTNIRFNKENHTIILPSVGGGGTFNIYGKKEESYIKYIVSLNWQAASTPEWEAFAEKVTLSGSTFTFQLNTSYPESQALTIHYPTDQGFSYANLSVEGNTDQIVSVTNNSQDEGNKGFSIKLSNYYSEIINNQQLTMVINFTDSDNNNYAVRRNIYITTTE